VWLRRGLLRRRFRLGGRGLGEGMGIEGGLVGGNDAVVDG
jgi:hypothetical protein